MNIIDVLSKLGASTKVTVGVSISPGIGLEMIEIDMATKLVVKYGFKPLEYNYSTREVKDYAEFQDALGELFDELRIPRRCNIVLTVPTVHFGIINLPLLLTDEAVTNAIISEVEQSYIFKRQEPAVGWLEVGSNVDTENRQLIYTAIQQSALDGLGAACQEIGCTLAAVEVSCLSLLKALNYTELTKDQMRENVTWNMMVVNQNSYSIFSFVDKKVVEYYEEPLALKSFVDDEIYNAITTSAQLTLTGLPANYMVIVSETDLVSAEVLSMKMPFDGTMSFIECNKYTQNEICPVNLDIIPTVAIKITPEAIGSAIYPSCNFPLKFNLIGNSEFGSSGDTGAYPKVNIGNLELELTPDFVKKVVLIAGASIAIPMILLGFILSSISTKEQQKLDDINAKITQDNDVIKKYKSGSTTFDVNATIKDLSGKNRMELLYYGAMGVSIPNKLWVTYYMSDSSGKVDIKGKSSDVDSVYAFYKSLKQYVANSDIRLYKLEIESGSIDDVVSGVTSGGPRYYSFEITNMTDSDKTGAATGSDGQAGTGTNATGTPGGTATGTASPGASMGNAPSPAGQPGPAPSAGKSPSPGPSASTPKSSSPSPSPSPSPSGSSKPSSGGEQLPKNLEKIEKF